jgi:DNA-binding MarR family transcriptional regulator
MASAATTQYRMIHDVYVLLDDGDQRLLREHQLTTSQFATLLLLSNEQGWRLTDLSERLLIDKSTVTRIIDRLEEAELVQRTADLTDRRVQRVFLTEAGQSQKERTQQAHAHSLDRRMGVLSPAEQQQLEYLLCKLRNGLQEMLERPVTRE